MKKINIGILAHVDAGKTTLTEQLCYRSGALRRAGSVEAGNSQSDFLAVERSRGISVRASAVLFTHGGAEFHLIDTPGHVDFAAEVERALSVLDAAVLVLSAVEGVQPQTELLYEALRRMRTPVFFFINKIDRAGSDARAVLADIRRRFTPRLVELAALSAEGDRSCAVETAPPGEAALELLAEDDDALLEDYLEGRPISPERLEAALAGAVADCRVSPALMGSAALGVGVDALLGALARYAPGACAEEDELSGTVYQITHDPAVGKVAHVRLFGGTVRPRDVVALPSRPEGEKVTQIRRYSGGRYTDLSSATAGDVVGLCGLGGVRVGDAVGAPPPRGAVKLSAPLLRVRVRAPGADVQSLLRALAELGEEDPNLGVEAAGDGADISICGTVQLEILQALARERYGLEFVFSPPSVIYRETPSRRGFGREAYTMPKPCWAVVELEIEPLPRGSGFEFASTVDNNRIFYRYQNHVREELPRALGQGLYGWEVTDLRVTLCGGSHHTIHTHPLDFYLATPMALMDGLRNTGTTLLEPLQLLRVVAPEACAGRIIGDMIDLRGEYDSPVIAGGRFHLEAKVPVATSMDYAVRLSAMTSGQGVLSARFAGYQECPPELGKTAERRGVNPLDREKWILSHRGAL